MLTLVKTLQKNASVPDIIAFAVEVIEITNKRGVEVSLRDDSVGTAKATTRLYVWGGKLTIHVGDLLWVSGAKIWRAASESDSGTAILSLSLSTLFADTKNQLNSELRIVSRIILDNRQQLEVSLSEPPLDRIQSRIEELLAWSVTDPFLKTLRASVAPPIHNVARSALENDIAVTKGSLHFQSYPKPTLSDFTDEIFGQARSFVATIQGNHSKIVCVVFRDTLEQIVGFSLLIPNELMKKLRTKYSTAFKSVQSAVESLPNNTVAYQILILSGTYVEQVNVSRAGPIYLLGQTTTPSNRTFNTVKISWAAWAGTGDDAYTATLTVAPNLDAALTGSGPTGFAVPSNTAFGNTDFRAYNIDFINDYKPYSGSPSLALSVGYSNTGFYRSRFYSYQDTVYVGKLGNAYFYDNEIAGETDFFYGFGTAWVNSSLITLRSCGGGITAWKGTNTTFVNSYGVYIHDSVIQKANSSLSIKGKCALGRPWNAEHRSIFANTSFDNSILPGGYIEWSSSDPRLGVNTTMAVYADYGAGYNTTALAANSKITKIFTAAQYVPYSTTALVFQAPFTGVYGNNLWIETNPTC
ncbi:hypothetical protein HK100_011609 [Physocladia obscura]|uniref:pectinesterase n=1 Tax=Physocladia obscura TaxID=109957 RepID=A0AAD5T2N9_9FUNG|nr:hypothetical protein HK100_011609 [Physocladia obscura]